jgi:hypothetical protein
MCNIPLAYSVNLPELLPAQCTVAIHGYSTRKGGVICFKI